MNSTEFRKELTKLMPGYSWTVHKSTSDTCLKATGTQSSGFNRLSTLRVVRTEHDGRIAYEAKSAGYGLRAIFLHTHTDGTLARALRGLQDHYEQKAATYGSHARSLRIGRADPAAPHEGSDMLTELKRDLQYAREMKGLIEALKGKKWVQHTMTLIRIEKLEAAIAKAEGQP